MMKKSLRYLCLTLLFLAGPFTNAQEGKLKKAGKDFENYGYINAREIYLKVAEKGYESEELYQKIADSYYFNAEYKKALEWYEKLFDLNEDPEAKYILRYSQSLKANGKNKKAKRYYDKFVKKSGKPMEGKVLTAEDYLQLIEANSGRYTIRALSRINTDGIDYGGAVHDGRLVFASTRGEGSFLKRESAWDGLAFLNLYEVEIEGDSVVGKPKKLSGEVNGKFHESSAVFTKDGKTMYFTRSNYTPDTKGEDQKLKIYRAHLVDGKWTNIEELSINGDDFSTAHPALDPDGYRLYFASDRPGGYGKSDLYMASIGKNGSLGKPENLGPKINTPGKETFPFVSRDNELYFSSNGHFGLGGLDVFYVQIEKFGFGDVLNVGEPINCHADDFAFTIDLDREDGFFSSNRGDSLYTFVYDDIYHFKQIGSIKNIYKAKISGTVTDKDTGEPISGATVQFFTKNDSLYVNLNTDENGYYESPVDYFSAYRIRAEKAEYGSEESISESEMEEQEINFELERDQLQIVPGTDLAKFLNIENIYFDFDKSNIRPSEYLKLEKLLTVLEEYPNMKIDIRSHTDSRGSDAYNEALSDRRAQSTLEYLMEKGIDKSRLTAKGYGEYQLVNECSSGVPCNEVQHQENRRSEFIIVE